MINDTIHNNFSNLFPSKKAVKFSNLILFFNFWLNSTPSLNSKQVSGLGGSYNWKCYV